LPQRHAVLIHPTLSFSGLTERTLATAHVLEGQGHRVTLVARQGSRARAAVEQGFALELAELPDDPLRSPFAALRTRKRIAALEPDILHATDDSLAPLMTWIAPALGVPWLLELHRPATGPLLRSTKHFAGAIVSSDSLVESVVNRGHVPRALVRVIHHAPQPRPEVRGPFEHEGRHVVACSGLLDDQHATPWFLEAARLMTLGGTRPLFAVLGEGPNEGALRQRARESGLAEQVTIGVPTTTDTAQSLGALDVHVSCRLEGGPGWLACQALAQGVPSVLAASGDAFELIEDRKSGLLVDPVNPRELADQLTSLLANPSAARRMGLNGRARILEACPPAQFDYAVAELHALALGTAVTDFGA